MPGKPDGFHIALPSGTAYGGAWLGIGCPAADHHCALAITSNANVLLYAFVTDTQYFDDPDEFMQILMDNHKIFMHDPTEATEVTGAKL